MVVTHITVGYSSPVCSSIIPEGWHLCIRFVCRTELLPHAVHAVKPPTFSILLSLVLYCNLRYGSYRLRFRSDHVGVTACILTGGQVRGLRFVMCRPLGQVVVYQLRSLGQLVVELVEPLSHMAGFVCTCGPASLQPLGLSGLASIRHLDALDSAGGVFRSTSIAGTRHDTPYTSRDTPRHDQTRLYP